MIRNGLRVRAKTLNATAQDSSDPTAIDAELIRELAKMVGETELAELEIQRGDLRIRLTRHHSVPSGFVAPVQTIAASAGATASPGPIAAVAPEPDQADIVKSPMVGTVYRRSNPDSKPFVDIGSVVKGGDRVLLVEAMKTFNDIVAHKSGTVTAIMVGDGQPVEYGEPLFLIE